MDDTAIGGDRRGLPFEVDVISLGQDHLGRVGRRDGVVVAWADADDDVLLDPVIGPAAGQDQESPGLPARADRPGPVAPDDQVMMMVGTEDTRADRARDRPLEVVLHDLPGASTEFHGAPLEAVPRDTPSPRIDQSKQAGGLFPAVRIGGGGAFEIEIRQGHPDPRVGMMVVERLGHADDRRPPGDVGLPSDRAGEADGKAVEASCGCDGW